MSFLLGTTPNPWVRIDQRILHEDEVRHILTNLGQRKRSSCRSPSLTTSRLFHCTTLQSHLSGSAIFSRSDSCKRVRSQIYIWKEDLKSPISSHHLLIVIGMFKSNPIAQTTKQETNHLPSFPTKTTEIRDVKGHHLNQNIDFSELRCFSCKGSKLYSQVCRKKFCLGQRTSIRPFDSLTQLLVPVGSAFRNFKNDFKKKPLFNLPEIAHWIDGLCSASTTNSLSSYFCWSSTSLTFNRLDLDAISERDRAASTIMTPCPWHRLTASNNFTRIHS